MKGEEFAAIRRRFGLKKVDWMYALGYAGSKNTMYLNCERYENGERQIPLYLAQYVWLVHELASGSRTGPKMSTETRMPVWPEWPAYYEKTS